MKTYQIGAKHPTPRHRRTRVRFGKVGGVSIRKSVNVNMEPAEKEFIERLSQELGLSETQIVTRTFRYMRTEADDVTVRGILGLLPPSQREEIKRRAIRNIGKKRKR